MSVKAFLIRKNRFSKLEINFFESYPRILTGSIINSKCVKPMINSIHSISLKSIKSEEPVNLNRYLIVDDDEKFLDECSFQGLTTVKVNKLNNQTSSEDDSYGFKYFQDTNRYHISGLLFMPHVIDLHNTPYKRFSSPR